MSDVDATPAEITAWIQARLPAEWTAAGAASVTVDREEITVVLSVEPPVVEDGADDTAVLAQAAAGRIAGFREETREQRMAVAREAEHRFDRTGIEAIGLAERLFGLVDLSQAQRQLPLVEGLQIGSGLTGGDTGRRRPDDRIGTDGAERQGEAGADEKDGKDAVSVHDNL